MLHDLVALGIDGAQRGARLGELGGRELATVAQDIEQFLLLHHELSGIGRQPADEVRRVDGGGRRNRAWGDHGSDEGGGREGLADVRHRQNDRPAWADS